MKILVFAEQRENKLKKPAFEVVTAASTVAHQTNGEVIAVVVGSNVRSIAGALGGYGARKVVVVEDPRLGFYSSTAYARAVTEVARTAQANVVMVPATAMGKDLAPRVAVRLDAGLVSDCTALRVGEGDIIATRPVFAGKALTDVRVTSAIKVFTLRPNVFTASASGTQDVPVELAALQLTDKDFIVAGKEVKQSAGKLDVAEADIIVTGGRGMKGAEHFTLIEQLAEAIGGAVGASRAVVDAGWRPHEEQVGQTGKTVSPMLYIAVGLSGAIQHLAGMSSSKYIVAINKDKEAPIFQVTTYGIVGDAFEIVPALTAEVRKLLGKS